MAFNPYHNIVGATAQDNELVALNDISKKSVKSIQITNVHGSAAATMDLYIFKDSTDTTASETYYFLKNFQLAYRDYLILDNVNILKFDNTNYSLHVNVGSTDTVDIIVKT